MSTSCKDLLSLGDSANTQQIPRDFDKLQGSGLPEDCEIRLENLDYSNIGKVERDLGSG